MTSFVDLPSLYAFGLQNTFYSNNQLLIYPGQARSQNNQDDITISVGTIVNVGVNGVNGLDVGTVSASTWYSVYVIYDSTLTKPAACLLSAQQKITGSPFTSPILPGGYSNYRRIGWALTDSSANFIPFDMSYNDESGNNCYRYYQWRTPIKVLTAGSSNAFTQVNLGSAVPYNERGSINLGVLFSDTGVSSVANIRPLGSISVAGQCPITVNSTVTGSVTYPQFPNCWITAQSLSSNFPAIEYSVTSGALSIWVNGFYDCF